MSGEREKFLVRRPAFAYMRRCPKSHVPVGVRWTSVMERQPVRYLELTPPVGLTATRQTEDILKQRRCGPFWCLPVVQRPGLLQRHTLIADSAERVSQSKAEADKASLRREACAQRRVMRSRWFRVSTGWFR